MSSDRRVSRLVHIAIGLVGAFGLCLFTNIPVESNLLLALTLFYLLPAAIVVCAIGALVQTSVHSGTVRGRELAFALLLPTSCLLILNIFMAPSYFSLLRRIDQHNAIKEATRELLSKPPSEYNKKAWAAATEQIVYVIDEALAPKKTNLSVKEMKQLREALEQTPPPNSHLTFYDLLGQIDKATDITQHNPTYFHTQYYRISDELGVIEEGKRTALYRARTNMDTRDLRKLFEEHTRRQ
jgi:hypothetical protein